MFYHEIYDWPSPLPNLFFPPAIDDYVGPDNPVRFIHAFVDGLDLTGLPVFRSLMFLRSDHLGLPKQRTVSANSKFSATITANSLKLRRFRPFPDDPSPLRTV